MKDVIYNRHGKWICQKNSIAFQTFQKHCIEGTSESLLVSELQPYEEDSLVYLYMFDDLKNGTKKEEITTYLEEEVLQYIYKNHLYDRKEEKEWIE